MWADYDYTSFTSRAIPDATYHDAFEKLTKFNIDFGGALKSPTFVKSTYVGTLSSSKRF